MSEVPNTTEQPTSSEQSTPTEQPTQPEQPASTDTNSGSSEGSGEGEDSGEGEGSGEGEDSAESLEDEGEVEEMIGGTGGGMFADIFSQMRNPKSNGDGQPNPLGDMFSMLNKILGGNAEPMFKIVEKTMTNMTEDMKEFDFTKNEPTVDLDCLKIRSFLSIFCNLPNPDGAHSEMKDSATKLHALLTEENYDLAKNDPSVLAEVKFFRKCYLQALLASVQKMVVDLTDELSTVDSTDATVQDILNLQDRKMKVTFH